jgi:hypothetical protein
MADPSHAAAGVAGPEAGQGRNPEEFTSAYDRNYLLMATILFKESFEFETGGTFELDPLKLWREQCEEPAGFRNAVPTWLWRSDPKIYGEFDSWGHRVEPHQIAPLLAYGSLRQLRDSGPGQTPHRFAGAGFPEDASQSGNQLWAKAADRSLFSFYEMYQNRICDPEYRYSIEEAVGNPREFPRSYQIRDTSNARLYRYDMYVPASELGESDFHRKWFGGCGHGYNCDITNPPSYYDSSLQSWVYVTSSDDPDVLPGWHRLIDVKAWPPVPCNRMPRQRCHTEHVHAASSSGAKVRIDDWKQLSAYQRASGSGLRFDTSRTASGELSRTDFSVLANQETRAVTPAILAQLQGQGRRNLQVTNEAAQTIFETIGYNEVSQTIVANFYANLPSTQLKSTYINEQEVPEWTTYTEGRQALLSARCSNLLAFVGVPFAKFCTLDAAGTLPSHIEQFQPYRSEVSSLTRQRCTPSGQAIQTLQLDSDPIQYGSFHYVDRFNYRSPPPTPPPSRPPPSPPSPPPPLFPPLPPVGISAAELIAKVDDIQARVCDSVMLAQLELAPPLDVRFQLGRHTILAGRSTQSAPSLAAATLPNSWQLGTCSTASTRLRLRQIHHLGLPRLPRHRDRRFLAPKRRWSRLFALLVCVCLPCLHPRPGMRRPVVGSYAQTMGRGQTGCRCTTSGSQWNPTGAKT